MYENENCIKWLQEWYYNNCDGEWEHNQNITITTIDNPGWSLTIRLEGTPMENKDYNQVFIERTELDWYCCRVEDNIFLADGGPFNLLDLMCEFRKWTVTFMQ